MFIFNNFVMKVFSYNISQLGLCLVAKLHSAYLFLQNLFFIYRKIFYCCLKLLIDDSSFCLKVQNVCAIYHLILN